MSTRGKTLNLTAVILAGGRSSRMGTSKALLPMNGQRLIDRTRSILNELAPRIQQVVVSGSVPETDFIPDVVPFRGPVGGIASAAKELISGGTDGLLVVPVDLPLLTPEALLPLITFFRKEKPSAVCFQESWLPAIFQLNENLISQCERNRSIHSLLVNLDFDSLAISDPKALTNANTPEEWARLTGSSL